MRSFVIVGLKALIGMIGIVLAFILWASLFDGYPWRERFVWLAIIAATPFVLRATIRMLEARRRIGVLLALPCILFGPTPMFFEATWIWSLALSIPLVVLWFQLGSEMVPASNSVRDAS